MRHFLMLIGLLFFASCAKNSLDSQSSNNLSLQELNEITLSIANKDYSCLDDFTIVLGGNEIVWKDYLQTVIEIGDSLHFSQDPGYYCPWFDCDRYDEFNSFYDSLADGIMGVDIDPTMTKSCEDFFDTPLEKWIFEKHADSLEVHIDSMLVYYNEIDYISSEEFNLLNDFFHDLRKNDCDIDYCNYYNLSKTVTTTDVSKGYFTKLLITTIPIVISTRVDLIIDYQLNADTNDNDDDDVQGLYGFYMLYRFSGSWLTDIYDKSSRFGNGSIHHDEAGGMLLGNATRHVTRGI